MSSTSLRSDPSRVVDAVSEYIQRGWAPIPVPFSEKGPVIKKWQELRYTLDSARDAFAPQGKSVSNVGLLTGEASNGLVNLDLDTPEALVLADVYAPPTNRKHGRPSFPASHWWYVAPGAAHRTFSFRHSKVEGEGADKRWCFVEVLANGEPDDDGRAAAHQTLVPPSVHPSGEPYTWQLSGDGEPAQVDAEALDRAARIIAAGSLLARLWPSKGSRDLAAMALAGWLLRAGWPEAEVDRFAHAIARAASDEEWRHRGKARQTQSNLQAGWPVTGEPSLAELLGNHGERACATVREWLQLGEKGPGNASANADRDERAPSIGAQLVAICEREVDLWHDLDGNAYATFSVGDHFENAPLGSKLFRRWLAAQFFSATKKLPNGQALKDALLVLEGVATFDGPQLTVATRLASDPTRPDVIYLDLADSERRVIEITPDGWRVLTSCEIADLPVRFRRSRGMGALPLPIRSGNALERLRRLVNMPNEESWRAFVGWLVAALRPKGPYPVLSLTGEHGTAKTTTARIARMLIDPHKALVRRPSRDERDLMIAATNNWIVTLDNVSSLPTWLSDAMCVLSTGGGYATRALWENDDEVIFNVQRPVIVTGIEEVATKDDLIDRALCISLSPISGDGRRSEAILWREFEEIRPAILGALLDTVAGALARLPTVHIDSKPRMADFAEWVVAAESTLGWPAGAFLKAYQGNRDAANMIALEASPVGEQLLRFMESRDRWDGTPTALYDELTTQAGEKVAQGLSWPRSARALSGILTRLAPHLRHERIEFSRGHASDKKGTRQLHLAKARDSASDASDASDDDASPDPNGLQTTERSEVRQISDALLTQAPKQLAIDLIGDSDASDASDADSPHFSADDNQLVYTLTCPDCGGHEVDSVPHWDGPYCARCDRLMLTEAS